MSRAETAHAATVTGDPALVAPASGTGTAVRRGDDPATGVPQDARTGSDPGTRAGVGTHNGAEPSAQAEDRIEAGTRAGAGTHSEAESKSWEDHAEAARAGAEAEGEASTSAGPGAGPEIKAASADVTPGGRAPASRAHSPAEEPVAEVIGDGDAARRSAGQTTVDAAPAATAGRAAGGVRAFARLFGSELRLLFRRPRNLAALGALAAVPVLLGVAVRVAGPGDGEGGAPAIVTQIAGNGLVLTFAAMFFLVPLLLPVAVAVVAGDSIAGEANSGTLRYLLTAPAGRTRLLAVKYSSVVVFSLAASLTVAASALVTGLLMFPSGPMMLLSGVTVPFADGLLRVLIVIGYVTVGMAAIGAVGLAISTLTEAPIGAIAATAALVIVAQVLQAIPQLAALEPYLVTSHWNAFDGALREPIAVGEMQTGLLVFAAYILVFGSIAWARFTSRDVTS
ncbi:ABC transporter permease [Thermopolyspora sp. NPDC052614]|uniref:ABC transporter permease n=1 Tax=Thermopolyspora sp. NPDC052614 TaxID=3155682 RepID=UPI003434BC6B